jgi:hypothetical protein
MNNFKLNYPLAYILFCLFVLVLVICIKILAPSHDNFVHNEQHTHGCESEKDIIHE